MRAPAAKVAEANQPQSGSHRITVTFTDDEAEAETASFHDMVTYRQMTERQIADRARDHLYT